MGLKAPTVEAWLKAAAAAPMAAAAAAAVYRGASGAAGRTGLPGAFGYMAAQIIVPLNRKLQRPFCILIGAFVLLGGKAMAPPE